MKNILTLILIFNGLNTSPNKIRAHNPNKKINCMNTALVLWTLANSLSTDPPRRIKFANFEPKQKFSKRNHQPKK